MEQRRNIRYTVRLSCRLIVEWNVLYGETLNVSCTGALIALSNDCISNPFPQLGDAVQADLLLPSHPRFSQRGLRCKAVAVRVSTQSIPTIVAFEFKETAIAEMEPYRKRIPPIGSSRHPSESTGTES